MQEAIAYAICDAFEAAHEDVKLLLFFGIQVSFEVRRWCETEWVMSLEKFYDEPGEQEWRK